MSNYADLEKEHGLEDIMPVNEYRHKAKQMEGALRQLVKHRRQIQGRDLAPSYDAVRFWPFVVIRQRCPPTRMSRHSRPIRACLGPVHCVANAHSPGFRRGQAEKLQLCTDTSWPA